MAKSIKKKSQTADPRNGGAKKRAAEPAGARKSAAAAEKPAKPKLAKPKLAKPGKKIAKFTGEQRSLAAILPSDPSVLDRLWSVVLNRREANPTTSHSARLLSRGVAKVAQKFGEEAVEAVIEAVAGNRDALIGESADVLYHLLVLWVAADISPEDVWAELRRREGVSGIAEKAARALPIALRPNTSKIP
jgi:phosphoribosyl-ATP pyrophosphohydrolase